MENSIFIAIIIIIVFNFVLGKFLDILNRRTWSKKLPVALKNYYDDDKYQKAMHYNFDNERLSMISSSLSFVLILLLLFTRSFGHMNSFLAVYFSNPVVLALVFFAILYFASDLLSVPFDIYGTFVIEEKYGFNKSSVKTFILDKLKSWLLIIILGGGLTALLLSFILWTGSYFWIYAFLALNILSLFINYFYTTLILPLFNTLRPLEDNALKSMIESYAKKVQFPLHKIFVMDGSKRSNKANAFFTGFFKKKKIVLYDTLIEKHEKEELLGILAHETGHYKKKHILRNMLFSGLSSLLMFYVLSLFIFNEDMSKALGAKTFHLHLNLIVFAFLFEPFSMITGILANYISRKQEFQADAFAVQSTGEREPFKKALIRLSTDHYSNLKPHPAYVFMHYSHPPLLKRLEAIDRLSQ
jgi:STE24 endopeptidase